MQKEQPRQAKPFDFRDFSALDTSQDANFLIQSMDRMYSLETIRSIKQRAIRLLNLKSGDHAIEIGCGLGHDAEEMGKIVGTQGAIHAIDSSQLMLAEARRRSNQPQVNYRHEQANKLSDLDNVFSAGYADRLLVSQQDPLSVIKEMLRVMKPGGTICITDIDLGSAIMSPYLPLLTDKLMTRLQQIVINPFIGRQLSTLLKSQGVVDIRLFSEAYLIRDFKLVNTMIDFPRMIHDLQEEGTYSNIEARQIEETIWKADKQGEFIYAIILFTVSGIKPIN